MESAFFGTEEVIVLLACDLKMMSSVKHCPSYKGKKNKNFERLAKLIKKGQKFYHFYLNINPLRLSLP